MSSSSYQGRHRSPGRHRTASNRPRVPRTLRTGCKGDDVKQLQRMLTQAGFNPGAADGSYGARTAEAVRNYQRSRGLHVPKDISVAGYDDYRAIAETLFPPLTTVDLAYRGIGEAAADQLLARIEGHWTGPDRVTVAGPLRWRQSVTDRNI